MAEYAANIASGNKIHVMQLYDWDADYQQKIDRKHIATGATFHDTVHDKRPGY